jgi:hypothetical protein
LYDLYYQKLVVEKEMSPLDVKPGVVLPPAITEMVKQSNMSDVIGSIFQGRKDCVSVNSEANKIQLQTTNYMV